MTNRDAMRIARRHAAAWVQGLIDAGWPYAMNDDGDPPESEEDCQRMQQAMQGLVGIIWREGGGE
ncbi:MAG TPA: hypothetical protein VM366_00090 [Anaerolineae bacterium]|nr:hypothetical protein [Anaerolineae bacterium]